MECNRSQKRVDTNKGISKIASSIPVFVLHPLLCHPGVFVLDNIFLFQSQVVIVIFSLEFCCFSSFANFTIFTSLYIIVVLSYCGSVARRVGHQAKRFGILPNINHGNSSNRNYLSHIIPIGIAPSRSNRARSERSRYPIHFRWLSYGSR